MWTNITIIIENYKFKVEYNYEDLLHSQFNSYERHIIWRYKYLNIKPEQMNKKDREIIDRFLNGIQILYRKEKYETGIYIKDIENMVAFNRINEEFQDNENKENLQQNQQKKQVNSEIDRKNQIQEEVKNIRKNQILLAAEEIKKLENK